jgi:uncharacterized protein (TIGR02145 family)
MQEPTMIVLSGRKSVGILEPDKEVAERGYSSKCRLAKNILKTTRLASVILCSLTSSVIAFSSVIASLADRSAQQQRASVMQSKRMVDGKQWTTTNLNVNTVPSYCYQDDDLNCRQYGRLYTWESAKRACQSLGDGWRLPTDDEWRQMARHYGGVSQDSDEGGKAAYKALLLGGTSGFNGMLGGGRSEDGEYARLEAHGFYWTATENDPVSALFYNFGKGKLALHRQNSGEKQRAFSVRCLRE